MGAHTGAPGAQKRVAAVMGLGFGLNALVLGTWIYRDMSLSLARQSTCPKRQMTTLESQVQGKCWEFETWSYGLYTIRLLPSVLWPQ